MFSLYIHMPWCVRKCPYCDFNSHALRNTLPEKAYIDSLLRDLDQDLLHVHNRYVRSLFFGGGTPSLFSPAAFQSLLPAIFSRLTPAENIEITLEANPGTIDSAHFNAYRDAGINRLSLGIQSFQDEKLLSLGRIHNSETARHAVNIAKTAGFTEINLDLMYGLPQQSLADAVFDLNTAVACEPTHLSWYHLTLEPHTPFYHRPPALPPEEIVGEIQTAGEALLAEAGYVQYEVSAFAKSGHRCQHNLNYWEFGDYLGIGAGAHSKITDPTAGTITRFSKLKHPNEYLAAQNSFIADKRILTSPELPFEFMMNALRLHAPVSLHSFETRTGLSEKVLEKPIREACDRGLLQRDGEFLHVTALGRRFLNDLITVFM